MEKKYMPVEAFRLNVFINAIGVTRDLINDIAASNVGKLLINVPIVKRSVKSTKEFVNYDYEKKKSIDPVRYDDCTKIIKEYVLQFMVPIDRNEYGRISTTPFTFMKNLDEFFVKCPTFAEEHAKKYEALKHEALTVTESQKKVALEKDRNEN